MLNIFFSNIEVLEKQYLTILKECNIIISIYKDFKEIKMIDSHCHLNDDRYIGEVNDIVKNFVNAGVEKVLNIGCDIPSSILAREQARIYDSVYYSVGFQPEFVDNYNEIEFERLIQECLGCNTEKTHKMSVNAEFEPKNHVFADNFAILDKNGKNKLLAIGEIGLDYYYTKENKELQIKVFESQIKLAKKYNLPILIHNRDASGDILEVLKRNAPFERGGIIHCFSASLEWAREVIKLGFMISFSGSVTFNSAKNLQEVAKSIDEEYLLAETDSPYLTPVPNRGKRNEPINVRDVANFIATLRNVSYDYIDKCTTDNFNRLFQFD